MGTKQITTAIVVGDELSPALDALDEPELTTEEKQMLVEEMLAKFNKKMYDYDLDIDLDSESDYIKDYKLARGAILDSMDKAKVIGDILLNMLAAFPDSLTVAEMMQDNIKLIQTSAKAIIQLHNDFSKNKQGFLSNQKLKKDVEEDDVDDVESKITEMLKEKGILFK